MKKPHTPEYKREYRNRRKDPTYVSTASLSIEQRFWLYVDVDGECWNWLGKIDEDGYGRFWVNSKTVGAHRFAYETYNKPILEGQLVCHTCDNPSCVNPFHLFVGTVQDNKKDSMNKNRHKWYLPNKGISVGRDRK